MRRLKPGQLEQVERLSPFLYGSTGAKPGLVLDVDPSAGPLVGFFLMRVRGELSPQISFDQGDGFNDLGGLALKAFPFAFYHVSRDRMPGLRRVRLQPSSTPSRFRLVAFQSSNAILVAILHYLFNLRYQNVALIAPGDKGGSRLQAARGNVARIAKFFRDVSKGGGVRVQQGGQETLANLRSSLSTQAGEVEERMHAALEGLDAPLISFVVPTWNTSPAFLGDLVSSFSQQRTAYAELVLSDDGSTDPQTHETLALAEARSGVRVVRNPQNRGIAATTNAGIAAAHGRWIAFVDHDDVLVAGATAVVADAIAKHPEALFFYTDELIVDAALKPVESFCKPAWDPVLLSGMNYINHLSVYRADRLAELGGLREDREGSQDYDLLLRYLAGATVGSIVHIPYLAYLWRRETASYSIIHSERSVASARRALALAYRSNGDEEPVAVEPALQEHFHKVRLRGGEPLVSIIIPNRDSFDLIRRVVADLAECTDYPRTEIIIVDNGTTDAKVLKFYDRQRRAGVVVDIEPAPFSFAGMCNRGARLAKGDALLFLNNDIEIESAESVWLSEMVECLRYAGTGIVGAKLAYPSGKAQHNGVIVGLGEAAGHWHMEALPEDGGPMGRLWVRQTLGAVTGACMLVSRTCFEALGGFDEEHFAIAYNDVDLCIRARAAGYRTVWTPFARLIHHESVSRGSDEEGEKNVRFKQEMKNLQELHGTRTVLDDAYSPFFDRRYSFPSIIVPDELPAPRPNVLP